MTTKSWTQYEPAPIETFHITSYGNRIVVLGHATEKKMELLGDTTVMEFKAGKHKWELYYHYFDVKINQNNICPRSIVRWKRYVC